MDAKIVNELEVKIEQTIADAFAQVGPNRLPLVPTRRTMHLMAKAAVTVYETAVENQRE
ncbi:MAG: hypothetical protein H6822_04495 [Planctomycetaceae bacterium]|nr:hypothetical protein [Planctomycetales bacterium]MCB9921414.1 hypothetical protein [Planctomycetaceae bacterium]